MIPQPLKVLEYYSPKKRMSKRTLDRYLAAAWFRTANMLFRSQVSCFDNSISSPINIRLRMSTHVHSKKMRKLLNRNLSLFQYEIKRASIDAEKEAMFAAHQRRFKSFLCGSLHEFLTPSRHFDTHEIQIYDGNKLVAVSFFDLGEKSMMSLLGIFDPRYASYSLGTYTMLLEIEIAKSNGFVWYYPGYVHEVPSVYDYKLRLGQVEVYSWDTRRWIRNVHPHQMPNMADRVKKHTLLLARVLEDLDVSFRQEVNLFFAWHYYQESYKDLFRCPIILFLEDGTALAYDAERNLFVHTILEIYIPFRDIRLLLADDFDKKAHCLDVMNQVNQLFSTSDIDTMKRYLRARF